MLDYIKALDNQVKVVEELDNNVKKEMEVVEEKIKENENTSNNQS